ncbi:MAG: methionyl-tRNA synthetase, partial [Streptosporangiaceae bacterium]|nr:methionyl-tRNA synthetase [Streptosporangiaceae bacterium]
DADHAVLEASRKAFDVIGAELGRSRFKNAIQESMRVVAEANKYLSDQAPWKLRTEDPERMKTILHVALQLIDDAKTLLTPFLPVSSQKVYEMLGGTGVWSGMPSLETVSEEGGPDYQILGGSYDTAAAVWESRRILPGTPLAPPTPLFTKLDPSVVDEELARLESNGQ